MAIYEMDNKIRDYAWGSKILMPEYFHISNTQSLAQAELWMGSHSASSSSLIINKKNYPLIEVLKEKPEYYLGRKTALKFGNKLPFLFKILAAATPLSIQAHPNKKQAEKGFRSENRKSIPVDDFFRNYKDNNHKPEIICAVSPFTALCGFRPKKDIQSNLSSLKSEPLELLIKKLDSKNGLKLFYSKLMTLSPEKKNTVLENTQKWIEEETLTLKAEQKMVKVFSETFPDDISVLSPLFLNIVSLQPGQAISLDSGELHAYLSGIGIEIMANSDNVLRGGLTVKNVDIKELLSILKFKSKIPKILCSKTEHFNRMYTYKSNAEEFRLSYINIAEQFELQDNSSARLLLNQKQMIIVTTNGSEIELKPGKSIYITPNSGIIKFKGNSTVFIADVPC